MLLLRTGAQRIHPHDAMVGAFAPITPGAAALRHRRRGRPPAALGSVLRTRLPRPVVVCAGDR
jgi:hypothetical protein